MSKNTVRLNTDSRELDTQFYQAYDEEFPFHKASTLYYVSERFVELRGHLLDFEVEDEKRYLQALRAELHFSEIHQAEALFALIFAVYQPLPHWVYLTDYKISEIRRVVEVFVEGDLDSITQKAGQTKTEFVQEAIYTGFVTEEPEKKATWNTNLENVAWLLLRIARKYLESAEYNAYKHGIRVQLGEASLSFYPDGQPEKRTVVASSPDSVTFLEMRRASDGSREVHQTTKVISPSESMSHMYARWRMVGQCPATPQASSSQSCLGRAFIGLHGDGGRLDFAN